MQISRWFVYQLSVIYTYFVLVYNSIYLDLFRWFMHFTFTQILQYFSWLRTLLYFFISLSVCQDYGVLYFLNYCVHQRKTNYLIETKNKMYKTFWENQ